jgi:hypothetical protein
MAKCSLELKQTLFNKADDNGLISYEDAKQILLEEGLNEENVNSFLNSITSTGGNKQTSKKIIKKGGDIKFRISDILRNLCGNISVNEDKKELRNECKPLKDLSLIKEYINEQTKPETPINKDVINSCSVGRIRQFQGTCWFNSLLNVFLLSDVFVNILIEKMYKEYNNKTGKQFAKFQVIDEYIEKFKNLTTTCINEKSMLSNIYSLKEYIYILLHEIYINKKKFTLLSGDIAISGYNFIKKELNENSNIQSIDTKKINVAASPLNINYNREFDEIKKYINSSILVPIVEKLFIELELSYNCELINKSNGICKNNNDNKKACIRILSFDIKLLTQSQINTKLEKLDYYTPIGIIIYIHGTDEDGTRWVHAIVGFRCNNKYWVYDSNNNKLINKYIKKNYISYDSSIENSYESHKAINFDWNNKPITDLFNVQIMTYQENEDTKGKLTNVYIGEAYYIRNDLFNKYNTDEIYNNKYKINQMIKYTVLDNTKIHILIDNLKLLIEYLKHLKDILNIMIDTSYDDKEIYIPGQDRIKQTIVDNIDNFTNFENRINNNNINLKYNIYRIINELDLNKILYLTEDINLFYWIDMSNNETFNKLITQVFEQIKRLINIIINMLNFEITNNYNKYENWNFDSPPFPEDEIENVPIKSKFIAKGGNNKVTFIKAGKQYTRTIYKTTRGTKYVKFNNKEITINKLVIIESKK